MAQSLAIARDVTSIQKREGVLVDMLAIKVSDSGDDLRSFEFGIKQRTFIVQHGVVV